ncbi:hypothetical protein B7P43_G05520 [Cryptotermes secundus]|uniref:Uncharacterized protein n=1 Tax=Cryptotermes secundus TaxID=105785 RepID=A0A2J7RN18_9NEOP|nr:hypothetical protein B7P43_G05520 [Cryptotermes secundus]
MSRAELSRSGLGATQQKAQKEHLQEISDPRKLWAAERSNYSHKEDYMLCRTQALQSNGSVVLGTPKERMLGRRY